MERKRCLVHETVWNRRVCRVEEVTSDIMIDLGILDITLAYLQFCASVHSVTF